MLHVSTTVKRLAMASLGACLLMLGTPLLGITPASAGTPSGPVTLAAPWYHTYTGAGLQAFSNKDSQITNFVINATEPGPGYDPIASMQMTLQDTTVNSAPQLKQTLTSAPWMFGLNPAVDGVSGNTQQLVFTAFNVNGVALASNTMGQCFAITRRGKSLRRLEISSTWTAAATSTLVVPTLASTPFLLLI